MADFPDSIFEGRALENAPGVEFDATKLTRLFAEDINNLNEEVSAIETFLEGGGGGSGGPGREPLTNGDPDSPELLFSNGDVIMG